MDVVDGTADGHTADFWMVGKIMFQSFDSVYHVKAAGLIVVSLIAHGFQDIISDVFDKPIAATRKGGSDCAAAGMAENDDLAAIQVSGSVFDASQLMVIQDITCHANYEQISNCGVEYLFGYDA